MVRIVRAWSLLALGLAVLAVPSRAQQSKSVTDTGGGIFDGSSGAKLDIPSAKSPAALAAAGEAKEAAQAAAVPPAKQSGHDLYAFTKEDAAAAKKKWGMRAQTVNTKGLVFDSDVPVDIQAQMRADMAFMGTIKGGAGTKLHQKIFGAVDGATYIKFFNSRVTGIGMDDCGSAKAVACVIPFQDPSKMWLTQNFIKFDHPQISRMMIVFHESRHTETRNGNWAHATCPTPFLDANGKDMVSIWTGATLAGEPACDITPLGSYGSSTILLKNVQKFCTNCTDKVKMDAGLYADDQLGRITDDGARQEMLTDFGQ
jgi:hypothetical protein